MQNGVSPGIFLITQYFINGYVKDRPYFDSDLRSIREGGDYEIDIISETLTVNGRIYRLPANYDDRRTNYDEAIAERYLCAEYSFGNVTMLTQ